MRVYSEARPAGGGKKYGLELTDSDMADVAGFTEMPVAERYKRLSDRADMLLVSLLLRRGDISREYAEQRLREIQQGHPA